MKNLFLIFTFCVTAFLAFLLYQGVKSKDMKISLGVINGKLSPCPKSPNCVGSFEDARDKKHFLAPIKIEANPIPQLSEILKKEQLTLHTQNELYIHATSKSSFWGFIDDVEFLYVPEENLLHFRSASRVGHSDMGVNRKRILKILSHLTHLNSDK